MLLAKLTGKQTYKDKVQGYCDYIVNSQQKTPKGLVYIDQWGSLRMAANAAFICAQVITDRLLTLTHFLYIVRYVTWKWIFHMHCSQKWLHGNILFPRARKSHLIGITCQRIKSHNFECCYIHTTNLGLSKPNVSPTFINLPRVSTNFSSDAPGSILAVPTFVRNIVTPSTGLTKTMKTEADCWYEKYIHSPNITRALNAPYHW